MSATEYELVDSTGTVRLRGTIEPPPVSPTPDLAAVLAAGNDAGALAVVNLADGVGPQDAATVSQLFVPAPAAESVKGAGAVTIADGAQAALTWAHDGGAALLSYAAPAAPTIIAEGVYAVTIAVEGGSLTAAGFYNLRLAVALGNAYLDSRPASAGHPDVRTFATVVCFCPAGQALAAIVNNFDGVAARDFTILTGGVVQRLY